MKALRYYGRKDLRAEDVPPPEKCAPNQAIVKISTCGVCGTDLHEYLAGPIFIPTKPDPFTGASIPQIIGHEFSGTIVAVGDELKDYREGDRVSIQPLIMPRNDHYSLRGLNQLAETRAAVGYSWPWGGMSEYAMLNDYNIAKLPDSVSDEQGALVEPAAVAVHAVRAGGVQVGNTLLISGGGPIGALAVLSAAAAGATIFVSEPNPARRELIESWGLCTSVLDPSNEDVPRRLRELTKVGVDVAIECVGHERSLATCLRSVKRQGVVVQVGLPTTTTTIDLELLVSKAIQLRGSHCFSIYSWPEIINLIASGKLPVEKLISKSVELDRAVPDAFDVLTSHDNDCLKILVRPTH
ncbi:MAG TPA: zinc-binding dehydrogenase [Chthoniobacterales bacterium]|nr:zinc-binding dehydrogenase [Chthoniobacterales bacterium]